MVYGFITREVYEYKVAGFQWELYSKAAFRTDLVVLSCCTC